MSMMYKLLYKSGGGGLMCDSCERMSELHARLCERVVEQDEQRLQQLEQHIASTIQDQVWIISALNQW